MNETPRVGDRVRWRKGEGVIVRLLLGWVEVQRDDGSIQALGYGDVRKAAA